jgi:hypothetical protein
MSDPISSLVKQLGLTGYNLAGGPGVAAAAPVQTSSAFNALASRIPEGIFRKTGIVAGIFLAFIIVLLIIHYWVRPIFKFHPDSRGILPVPFASSGEKTYWKKDNIHPAITGAETPLGANTSSDYSITVDMIIVAVDANRNIPLIVRNGVGAEIPTPFTPEQTLNTSLGNPNLAITLMNGVNDLLITTTVGTTATADSIRVKNIPIQTPFTIGIILGEKFIEAYLNGKLVASKQLNGFVSGGISSFKAIQSVSNAYIRNLRIWPNTVTPAVMRSISIPTMADFGNPKLTGLEAAFASSCTISE